jgi:hypothetical protein
MYRAYALIVLAALSGSLLAYGMLSSGGSHERQPTSRLSTDDTEAMRVAATGAWRTPNGPMAAEPAESAAAPEVVTIPAAQFQHLTQKGNAAPDKGGSITFALQRELARVGCYGGEINGAWTAATRQAMKAFMERVNATLPINQPDPVHLALVRTHEARVCGAPCPPGQTVTGDGTCMHSAMLPSGARKGGAQKDASDLNSSPSGWSTTTTVAPSLPSTLSEGQMALAGPRPEADLNAPTAKPVTPSFARPRLTHDNSRGDWRAELWKRQN